MISATNLANERLRDLWVEERKRSGDDALNLFPLQYPELRTGELVFVGMNPSHEASNEPVLRVTHAENLRDAGRIARVIDLELHALGRKEVDPVPYFRPLREFAPSWEHLDLFAVRDSSQRRALGLLQPDGVLTAFADAQLRVFEELLPALEPKVVVFINAAASAIFRGRVNGRSTFDEESGHHRVQLGGRPVPVFFSGMLTGQRALDVHSRERLIWHVRRTLTRLP